MDTCQVKKGIFVLSPCGAASSIRCDSCLISICNKHGQQDGPKILCPDCFAKAHPEKLGQQSKTRSTLLEDDYYRNYNIWYFGTRHNFYNSHHYSPFMHDDYRQFENRQDQEFQDENASASFFDS